MKVKLASLEMPDGSRSETTQRPLPGVAHEPSNRKGYISRQRAQPKIERPSGESGDWVIMIGGVTLAAVCALFPWYIFFNQQDFGVRPMTFEGQRVSSGPRPENLPELVGMRIPQSIIELSELDYSATGAIGSNAIATFEDQPYPGDKRSFRLIGAANGRAMIEDDDGYWIVQRGSSLPDGSRVARIRQRSGHWEILTSDDLIISAATTKVSNTQGPHKTGDLK